VNHQSASAPVGFPLRGLKPIEDPSDEIIEVHVSALKWNILQRRFGLVASDLAKLQQNSVELLELLKSNLPERNGARFSTSYYDLSAILKLRQNSV